LYNLIGRINFGSLGESIFAESRAASKYGSGFKSEEQAIAFSVQHNTELKICAENNYGLL